MRRDPSRAKLPQNAVVLKIGSRSGDLNAGPVPLIWTRSGSDENHDDQKTKGLPNYEFWDDFHYRVGGDRPLPAL
ncbi:hypothetical protein FP2506_16419 [Fulvimarina pelagi HTCC2506]|uniref:Uncharacterized protein n=1 Tax=Fulvimarina pelagi HTCC2506 TaxID=314231 RepID=Q0G2Z6_9HYPH|nr:hypothetical protein FP2506_16419 [Fulvimarina pelagi HTCC2506]